MTGHALISYCEALEIHPWQLFTANISAPITGGIESEFEIQPVPPNTPQRALALPLSDDAMTLAAVRWAPSGRLVPMRGHIAFYKRHEEAVPDQAWDKLGYRVPTAVNAWDGWLSNAIVCKSIPRTDRLSSISKRYGRRQFSA